MLSITQAHYLNNYAIALTFNNGMAGIANLQEVVFYDKRNLFTELQSVNKFQQFHLEHDTVTWVNGLDLAPEFLFFLTFKNDADYQEIFKQWGYIL